MKNHRHKYQTIFVDVDGTLILWSENRPGKAFSGVPKMNMRLIRWLIEWRRKNPEGNIYVWSTSGAIHAEWAVEFCGLEELIDGAMAKPDLIVDDSFTWLKKRARMHPDLTMAEQG